MPRLAWTRNRTIHISLWILMVVGITLILLPRIDQWVQERKQNELLTDWPEGNDQVARDAPVTQSQDTAARPALVWKEIDGISMMGTITVDKIDLREPLLKGATDQSLDLGIGVMGGDSFPGSTNNLVLAGHRSLKLGKHFNRLGELELGDQIVIESSNGAFTYSVERSFLVEPNDLSVLDSHPDQTELTLITCHPIRNPTHRLIVKATLVQESSKEGRL
ncbi:class D sortase [Tumebacillus lipolyticus]|uniref:Class D sortase n=1 Tax=Tumebacillus lipolyticus TaxID=1280370 RepID=A0ABW5A1Q5_9BACL